MYDEKLLGPLDFDPEALRAKYALERDRRIRPEGKAQYVGTDGRFEKYGQDPWSDPEFQRPPLTDHTSVIIAGGGFGGLLLGARLREQGVADIRVIEEGGDFGGTWYWNRYPGAMCDIEAHIYMPLLEELNYAPKHRYAYADELLDLSQRIGKNYGLYDKACFQTSITDARWDAQHRRWLVETNRDDAITADYLLLACGRQSLPKLPSVPGIETYEGHIFHSSRWDYAYTGGSDGGPLEGLRDKRVGLVGTGATALQIVPAVAQDAQHLYVFQRTPSTVGWRGQQPTGHDWADMTKPGWQRARRENFQAHVALGSAPGMVRPDQDLVNDGWTNYFEVASERIEKVEARLGRAATAEELTTLAEVNDFRLMNLIRGRVDELVEDPSTAEALKPWYRWWCKRPGWHDEYLPAFNRPNVSLVDSQGQGIEAFTPHGVRVGGIEYEVDCLVMATGFEFGISYNRLTGFDLLGEGVRLSEHWRDGVRTLHGLSTDRFPNLFFVGGNAQTASAVNAVHLLDEQATYVAHVIGSANRDQYRQVVASSAAVDAWVDEVMSSPANAAMLAFYAECTPGYYNAEGSAKKSTDLFSGGRYGGGPLAYYALLEQWRDADQLKGYEVV